MKLVPYIRQSNSREKNHGRLISIEEQRAAIRRWAETHGATLLAEVVEKSTSGAKSWRDRALGDVIARCTRGEAEGVIVAWQDRLSRENGAATAEVWDELQKADLRLVCAAERTNYRPSTDHDGEMLFTIKAAVARHQWKRYRANWDAAKQNAIDRGVPPYPNEPIGLRRREDGTLEPIRRRRRSSSARSASARRARRSRR